MGLQRVGGSGDADSGMQTQTQREREVWSRVAGCHNIVVESRQRQVSLLESQTSLRMFPLLGVRRHTKVAFASRLFLWCLRWGSVSSSCAGCRRVLHPGSRKVPCSTLVLSSDPYCAFESRCLRGMFEGSINSKPQNLNPRPSSLKA